MGRCYFILESIGVRLECVFLEECLFLLGCVSVGVEKVFVEKCWCLGGECVC